MKIEQTEVSISAPDGQMPAFLLTPTEPNHKPAVLLLMEAFGLTSHIRDVAIRIAREGYVVLVPDLYYRELPNNKFGYDEVESAMAMMYRLDLKSVEADIRAALAFLKSQKDVYRDKPGEAALPCERIGVTGFCLGGGLSFLTACKFSAEIAAAAPFYGMVLDEWIDAVKDITVPVHLFFGGVDPFIPCDRIRQIESRFQELGKDYTLKVYPNAGHGFFCHERSDYNRLAAEDAWQQLTQFFKRHLHRES
ncbi:MULTISPECIES: dienelactone hydrolase family protein [Nostocales]|uniref:Dienelactone hydrolase n=3 Tax=Nostocales TaxID=1161 RepID=A0A0C1RLG1_9CYAN|nr:dienelactone hydrolase family protein [Tolypothrix bouteillei]KAF3888275.1 dienelactone hydrolase family protein [Tolypothrix bouteillei VB521301]